MSPLSPTVNFVLHIHIFPLPQRLSIPFVFPSPFLLRIKCTRMHTHTVAELEKEVVDLKQITEKLRKSKKL